MIALTRCYRFAASHVLASPLFDAAENDRIYGKCANPNGHGHDYGLEVTVTGDLDPDDGRILDPGVLDRIVAERVLAELADSHLNDHPAFAGRVPTAENIAVVAHDALAKPIATATGARLLRVRVRETKRNHFDHGEPE